MRVDYAKAQLKLIEERIAVLKAYASQPPEDRWREGNGGRKTELTAHFDADMKWIRSLFFLYASTWQIPRISSYTGGHR